MYIKKFDPHKIVLCDGEGNEKVITCDEEHEFDYDIIKKIWEDFE